MNLTLLRVIAGKLVEKINLLIGTLHFTCFN